MGAAGRRPSPEFIPSGRSISTEQIDNGYLIRESTYGPDGYSSSTTYTPKAPDVSVNPDTPEPDNSGSMALKAAMTLARGGREPSRRRR